MFNPYQMIQAARAAPELKLPRHAVVRQRNAAVPSQGWELGGIVCDAIGAATLADCLAALYPPRPTVRSGRVDIMVTPGPWEVAELRDNPMGGDHAVSVHTGTARELVSPRELDMLHELMADARDLLEELVEHRASVNERAEDMRELVGRLDDLYPDEAERTVSMDRAERRAFTPHEPECLPD